MPRRFKTPGPGSYDITSMYAMGGEKNSPTAAFKSSSSRIAPRALTDGGDPGAYDVTAAGPKASLAVRTRETFSRSANSWSSSARGRSASPHSARGGPGEHDYSNLYEMGGRHSVAVTSSFKSNAPLGQHIRRIDTPGPGIYDPDLGPLGRGMTLSQGSMSKDGHSMFAGSTKRLARSASSSSVGPTTYSPHGSMMDELRASQNPRLPGFASSTPRMVQAASPTGRSRSPAPGDYDDFAGNTLASRARHSHNASVNGGGGGGYRFGSNSARSTSSGRQETGDPGAYLGPFTEPGISKGNYETVDAKSRRSFNTEVGKGRGTFYSKSARSFSSKGSSGDASQRGGPGEHDYSNLYEIGRSANAVTSSFKSNAPLGQHIRRIDTPGPGIYDPDLGPLGRGMTLSQGSMSKDGHSMFAGSTKQRVGLLKTSSTERGVGPGSYEPRSTIKGQGSTLDIQMQATKNERLPGFASSAPRDIDDYDA